jgi:integrase
MAQIEQRESGYWQARIRRRGYPAVSQTFELEKDAKAWARAIEREMDLGSYVPVSRAQRITFKELASRFEIEFAPQHYRGNAWRHKLAALRSRLGPLFLVAITPQVVSDYRDARLQDPDPRYRKDPGAAPRISPATVKSELDLLAKLLDVAAKEFAIPLPAGNPVAGVRKPKSSKPRDRRLTADEWATLERECLASRNLLLWPAVQLSIETAMRQGELLGLAWRHVDKRRRYVKLENTKNGEARAVPLTSTALKVLEGLPRDLKGRVIPTDRMTLYKAFERACQRAGIEDYTWHDLRHEALSRLAERGDLSVLELAAVSGHKTLQMLKRYTHLQAEKLAHKLG